MKKINQLFSQRSGVIVVLLTLIILGNSTASFAASLTSTVNRNTMSTNETLTLQITLDEKADTSDLDLSELRNDFEILGVSPRNSTSISTGYGKTSRVTTTQWTITLAAKREGNLSIPAFKVKQAVSKAISISASNSSGISSAPESAPLTATGSANKASVYPNEQLIFEVELSAADTVADINGAALESANASIELISQQQFQRIDNGVSRRIITLKYAIFAEQSGSLTIPSLTFTGLVGGRRSIFGNQGQKVIGRTKPLTVEVKDKPKTNGAPWFPAEAVSINSSWSGDKNAIKTGEPITRTIIITASGQLATAIAPLNQADLRDSKIKSYKDKPQLNSQKTNNGYISTRTESEAIVVNAAGDIELPAITIDWFNVNTNEWQQATLAAETISVSGDLVSSTIQVITPIDTGEQQQASDLIQTKTHWAWPIATALLSLICLLQFFLLVRTKKTQPKKSSQNKKAETEKKLWKTLITDLKGDDPKKIRNSLITWTRSAHPQLSFVSLSSVYGLANPSLKQSVEQLESLLFKNDNDMQLSEFKNELEKEMRAYRDNLHAGNTNETDTLDPLYL